MRVLNERQQHIVQQLRGDYGGPRCGVFSQFALSGYGEIPTPSIRRLVGSLRRRGFRIERVTCDHGIQGYRLVAEADQVG